jgi:Concanavalin A-like lectin/glucanases superfamily
MNTTRLFLWSTLLICGQGWAETSVVLPSVASDLVCHYDFGHPVQGDSALEGDLGASGTPLQLVNGGTAMRTEDAAYPGAGYSLQTRQLNPASDGNDDWKAGVYDARGVATLHPFNAAAGITLMGWIKPTGRNPNPDTTSEDPADFYGAIGLFGLLSGTSDGHLVRALLEIIQFGDAQRLVALGRRLDEGNSMILAAQGDWDMLLPINTWTHLAATFDYDEGRMALYRNGEPLPADYTAADDPWQVEGNPEPDRSSASDPAGIKVGGSFPQNNRERNAFNGRFDDLMLFDRALTAAEVRAQFRRFTGLQDVTPAISE